MLPFQFNFGDYSFAIAKAALDQFSRILALGKLSKNFGPCLLELFVPLAVRHMHIVSFLDMAGKGVRVKALRAFSLFIFAWCYLLIINNLVCNKGRVREGVNAIKDRDCNLVQKPSLSPLKSRNFQ